MDILYTSLLFTSLLTMFLFNLLRVKSKSKANNPDNPDAKLIPGPPKLPIIGNLHHIYGTLTHHTLRDLASVYGPLMHLQFGEVSAIVISSPDVATEVMKTHDVKFASRPELIAANIMIYGATDLLFTPYGEYWRQLRKLCVMELLSVKRVHSSYSVRQAEVSKFLCTIYSKGSSPVNLSAMFHSLTNDMTARAAFGNKCRDKETYLSAMNEALKFGLGFSFADLFPSSRLVRLLSGIDFKLGRCHQKIDRILDSIIEEHKEWKKTEKEEGGGDTCDENFLDVLLRLQEPGSAEFPLTTTAIKALLFDVFQAGTGSSSSVLNWAMSELIKNPRVMKVAQDEVRSVLGGKAKVTDGDIAQLKYLSLVIKEVLRLHPPAPLLVPRECTESCRVQGYEVPVKTRVIINAWAIGRHPHYWDDPEAFKPERFDGSAVDFKGANFQFIPFGAGRRMCPGISFGLASIELALAQFLYYFDWSLPGGMRPQDLDMTETAGLGARKKHDLYLCATPRVPLPISFFVGQ